MTEIEVIGSDGRVLKFRTEMDKDTAIVIRAAFLTVLWGKMSTLQPRADWTAAEQTLYGEELSDLSTLKIGILARDVLKQFGPFRPSVKELRDYARDYVASQTYEAPGYKPNTIPHLPGGQKLLDDRSHIRDNVLPPLRAQLDELFARDPEFAKVNAKLKADRAKSPGWNADVDHAKAEEIRTTPIDDAMRRIVRQELIDAGFEDPTPAMIDHRCRSKMTKLAAR